MEDERLRRAFVSLCNHLNVKASNPWRYEGEPISFNHEFFSPGSCKLARKADIDILRAEIDDLQRQIDDELKKKLTRKRK